MAQHKKSSTLHTSLDNKAIFAEEFSDQENLLQLFLNCADHTAVIKDTSLRYVAVNDAFLEQSGFKNRCELIGKTAHDVFSDRLTAQDIDIIDKHDRIALALPKGENIAVELNLPAIDGENRIYLSKRFAIYDDQERVIGMGGLSTNITERKLTEQELTKVRKELNEQILIQEKTLHDANENLQFMNHVFKNTLDGVIITDASGKALQINPAFTEITGYTLDDIRGENPRVLKSDYHDADFYKEMWASLKKTGKWDGELWNRRKSGEIYPQRLNISAIYNSEGIVTHYVGVNTDVSELKRNEEKINFYAYHDALTNLPNRKLFSDRVRNMIKKCKKTEKQIALLYIDFDDFKKINDSRGYHVGDELLKLFTERIKNIISESEIFARIGSDEFAIAIVDFESVNSLMLLARKIHSLFLDPFVIEEHELFINVSIGISTYPDDANTPETLLQHADTAMHQLKGENGSGGEVRFYTSQMQVKAQNKIEMESAIRKGLASEEFIPFYQAKINSDTGKVIGMEALARWVKEDGTIVPPGEFIGFAEELNLIGDIDSQILEISLHDMRDWEKEGHTNLVVSVNISAKEIEDPNFTNKIFESLEKYNVGYNKLELELTESLIMKNVEEKIILLQTLSASGIKIAIDDFGTGYSSLSYLKTLPINTLKIDRSFVNDISDDPNDMAIVSAIISMASKMGLDVIAEGVEHEEQIKLLKAEGCTSIQGFYYSKPLPKSEFLDYLALHA